MPATPKNTHGGRRPGAGRKPSPPPKDDAVPWFALSNAEFLEALMSNREINATLGIDYDKA